MELTSRKCYKDEILIYSHVHQQAFLNCIDCKNEKIYKKHNKINCIYLQSDKIDICFMQTIAKLYLAKKSVNQHLKNGATLLTNNFKKYIF